ncbi:MAG: FtsX-like permease family protein [Candidatus Thermoplasmatota archaeon]|nr:FtsX-like permease family protein [Candidatus Thermoplasmatota archaeon]
MSDRRPSFNSATYALSHLRHDLFRSTTIVITLGLTIAFILLTSSLLFGLVNEISGTDEKASILEGRIPGSLSMFEEFRLTGNELSEDSKSALVNYLLVTSTIVFAVALFIMFNTMSIAVQERRSEIGVLRSVGFSSKEVMKIFLTEGAVIGTISFLGALFLGTPFIVNLAAYLIDRGESGIFFVQPVIPLQLVVIIGALTITLTVSTTYLAIRKNLGVDPVEMLRPSG